ncbi:hypothetical protein K450DRAFT_224476 [Umbelopsis ramanniana AG]|uniref:Uncharacterized protein n=1 Tax=Umbelopsis ramanniana AG TaxID=1314678 RepID=A0AAD5HHZ9_UMBRA|nr:uncharacterized protein K450DRAFT_224476 [Umbelopsis ramanniana AG]KAI8583156.1 hypothetical protein K450DRAFT_224476 [Umbelopsis ramanniana AG]
MLMNAQINHGATNGYSSRCYRCNRMDSLQPCNFCEHAICSNCRQHCSTCNNEFCGTCSTIDYSSHIERTFCLSCSSQ